MHIKAKGEKLKPVKNVEKENNSMIKVRNSVALNLDKI
jgi:hypothetical protein